MRFSCSLFEIFLFFNNFLQYFQYNSYTAWFHHTVPYAPSRCFTRVYFDLINPFECWQGGGGQRVAGRWRERDTNGGGSVSFKYGRHFVCWAGTRHSQYTRYTRNSLRVQNFYNHSTTTTILIVLLSLLVAMASHWNSPTFLPSPEKT